MIGRAGGQRYCAVAVPRFVEDLREVGVDATSPWDLVNSKSPYSRAIPVLLRWLDQVDEDVAPQDRERFREGLVRALTVKEAVGIAAPRLVDEFRGSTRDWTVRWATGNALSVVADEAVFEDIVELLRDGRYGRAREMLVKAVARTDRKRAIPVLVELLADDDLAGHALQILRRWKVPVRGQEIERLLSHPVAWVRDEAKKVLNSPA